MISGFMTLKNVLKTGYPFVESIAASLPICDELLISEGYSTDGTFEVLEKIAALNRKIKVFRQEWPTTKNYRVIAVVTNTVRAKCRYDYIFSIQANEIVHEDSVEFIKALPEICPQVNTFTLPFVHLVKDYKFYEDFRLRFAKNLKNIIAVSDAWTLGPSDTFTNLEARKCLIHPRRLRQYINKGIEWTYANTCSSSLSRAIYLPKPIYRYWSLFPSEYLEKCQKHIEMFGLDNLIEDIAILKNHSDDPVSFLKKAAEIRRKELGFHYPDALGIIELEDHPKVVKGLLADSSLTSYHVREEVLDSIKAL
jgi:glycosyltransferase involved in cell wall biosynthesis